MKDDYFMDIALKLAADALEAGQFPVGCILVANNNVVAEGFRHNSRGETSNELDHAEILALKRWIEKGMPGKESGPVTAYTTLEPCMMCLGALIINGINRVVFAFEDVMGGATGIDFTGPFTASPLTSWKPEGTEFSDRSLYFDYGRNITGGIQRTKALELFRSFFQDPSVDYWNESMLSRYILSQSQ